MITAPTFWQAIELAAAAAGIAIDDDLDGARAELREAGAVFRYDERSGHWRPTLPMR
jgi:hypothetical protein